MCALIAMHWVWYSHSEAAEQALAVAQEEAQQRARELQSAHDTQDDAATARADAAGNANTHATAGFESWLQASDIPITFHVRLSDSIVGGAPPLMGASDGSRQLSAALALRGSSSSLSEISDRSPENSNSVTVAFVQLHTLHFEWRAKVLTQARAIHTAQLVEESRASEAEGVAASAAPELQHLGDVPDSAAGASKTTRAERKRLDEASEAAAALAAAETPLACAVRIAGERALEAWAVLKSKDEPTMEDSDFRDAVQVALSTDAANVWSQLLLTAFKALDLSILAAEAHAAATSAIPAAQKTLQQAQRRLVLAERQKARCVTGLTRDRSALEEKRRACTFLKNQIQSAEEEAKRSTSAAGGGAAASKRASGGDQDDGEDQDCCRICLEPYDDRVMTKCLHNFCGVCIGDYLKMAGARSGKAR